MEPYTINQTFDLNKSSDISDQVYEHQCNNAINNSNLVGNDSEEIPVQV